jgi:hypothetical protein
MVIIWVVGEPAEVDARCPTDEALVTVGEVLRQVADPTRRGILREPLLLDKGPPRLGQQLLTPDEVEQFQALGDTAHQLVHDAREDDVGVENRSRRACAAHSAGAPIASRSRDHSAVRRSCSARRSSRASTDDSGIFQ